MAFTQKEIQFLEDNRELIEQGSSAISEIAEKIMDLPKYDNDISRVKLIFAIVYSIQGVDGFSARVTANYKTSTITGALLNRTAAKAQAAPLLPSMMKAKTKIVYYKIENNKISAEEKSKFVDLATYKKELADGGYNLVVIDTQENIDSVKAAFGGIIEFTVRLLANVVSDRGVLLTVSVESDDAVFAKDLAKTKLTEGLTTRCDGMSSVVGSVVNSVIDKTDFKV